MKAVSKAFSLENILFFQRTVCVFLITAMLILSFGGFFTMPFNDDFSEFYTKLDEEEKQEFEEGCFVKFDFLGSFISIFKMIGFSNSTGYEMENTYHEVVAQKNGHSLSMRSSAIAFLIMEGYDNDFTVGIYFTLAALISLSTPIILAVLLYIIFRKYKYPYGKKDFQAVYKGVMRQFRIILIPVPMMILLTAIAPKVDLGFSGWALIILCGAVTLINAVSPYFKDYTRTQRKYLIMLQCMSLLGIAVFAVFCISLIRSYTVSKAVAIFDTKSLSEFFALFGAGKIDIEEIISCIAALIFLFGLLGVCHSLRINLCRLGLVTTRMKKKDYSQGDAYPVLTIRPNIMILIYLLLINSQSELIFYNEQKIYFAVTMICVVLMTFVEVGIMVLKNTLCIDLGNGGRDVILQGSTYHPEAKGTKDESFLYGSLPFLKFFR